MKYKRLGIKRTVRIPRTIEIRGCDYGFPRGRCAGGCKQDRNRHTGLFVQRFSFLLNKTQCDGSDKIAQCYNDVYRCDRTFAGFLCKCRMFLRYFCWLIASFFSSATHITWGKKGNTDLKIRHSQQSSSISNLRSTVSP